MSVELPPLPKSAYAFADLEGDRPDIPAFSADQMRAYALAALAERKPLTDEKAINLIAKHGNWSPHQEQLRLIRAIERAHGIGVQQ